MRSQPLRETIASTSPQEQNPKDMLGKTVLITGANSGIGLATACELAKRGAHVILLCRDQIRGQEALEHVNQAAGNTEAELLLCDLASFASVREAAAQFLKTHSRLDVLINNAGIHRLERHVTIDGYEEDFEVNHLSHFLLTYLLLPVLKASAPSRIINVSSILYHFGHIHWDDLQLEKHFGHLKSYNQSKLANILFTIELAKRVKADGITVNCLHPGLVVTNMNRYVTPLRQKMFNMIATSPEKGASTSVYLATSKEVEHVTGCYFAKNKIHALSSEARNETDAAHLWAVSEKLTGISFLSPWKVMEQEQKKAA